MIKPCYLSHTCFWIISSEFSVQCSVFSVQCSVLFSLTCFENRLVRVVYTNNFVLLHWFYIGDWLDVHLDPPVTCPLVNYINLIVIDDWNLYFVANKNYLLTYLLTSSNCSTNVASENIFISGLIIVTTIIKNVSRHKTKHYVFECMALMSYWTVTSDLTGNHHRRRQQQRRRHNNNNKQQHQRRWRQQRQQRWQQQQQ